MSSHYRYYQPFPPSYILRIAYRFSCWIQEMVPTSAMHSTPNVAGAHLVASWVTANSLPL